MGGRQRHGDGDMAFVDIHAIDQAQIIDIHRNFRVVDFLERIDHRFINVAARLTGGLRRGCLR